MTLLAVDCGNTHCVFACITGTTQPRIAHQWRMQSIVDRTAEEYAAIFQSCLDRAQIDRSDIHGMIIASVVPTLNTTLRQMGEQLLKCPVAVVGEEVTFATMPIRITRPEDAGVDRLINAKAAYQRNPQAQIIIDFGTATTFDVVAQDGGYEGGAIAPGIGLSFKALHTGTAKLPQIAFDPYRFGIPDPVGKNTADAMKAGIFWGYVGLIKGMTEAIVNSDTDNTLFAHTSPPIVGTGGLADLFAPYITNLETVPDLTIQGLIALWQEYADAASR